MKRKQETLATIALALAPRVRMTTGNSPRHPISTISRLAHSGAEISIDKIAMDDIEDYMRETRDMRSRYIGDLLKNGWNTAAGVLLSPVAILTRTVFRNARSPAHVPKR